MKEAQKGVRMTDEEDSGLVESEPAPSQQVLRPTDAGLTNVDRLKTLARRLRTLAFHIDFLYDYIKNHSDHRHADLSFELVKVTALSEMADEFCADLPDDVGATPAESAPRRICTPQKLRPTQAQKTEATAAQKGAPEAEQPGLI